MVIYNLHMDPSQLPSLAWFAHVARQLSFTRAAEEMGVSRAALSQSLKALEAQLGVRLLHRTTRQMSLTEAGQTLFNALKPSLAEIDRALQSLDEVGQTPSGTVKVNTSRLAARALIEPYLEAFHRRYPRVALELVMADGLSSIIAEGCDVGIRLGRSLAEHVVAVPISPPLSMAVVGSPAYLQRAGTPGTPQDLAKHNCLNYRFPGSGAIHEWEFAEPGRNGRHFTQAVSGNLTTNDDGSMIHAAVRDAGLIQVVDIAVQRHVTEGRLVQVLGEWIHRHPGFHLYYPSREQLPAKVRALIDFLTDNRGEITGL